MKSEDASGAFLAAIPSPMPPTMTHSVSTSVMIFNLFDLLLFFCLMLSVFLFAWLRVFAIVVLVMGSVPFVFVRANPENYNLI